MFRFVQGVHLSDTQSGLRAFPRRYFERFLAIKKCGYEYEIYMLVEALKIGRIKSFPVSTVYLPGNPSSHFRPILDSLRVYSIFVPYFLTIALVTAFDFVAFNRVLVGFENSGLAFFIVRSISACLYFLLMKYFVFKVKKYIQSGFAFFNTNSD